MTRRRVFERVGGGVEEAVVLQSVPRARQPQPVGHNTDQVSIFFFSKFKQVTVSLVRHFK